MAAGADGTAVSADRFGSLYPKYKGGRPPKFTLPQRREVKKIAKSKPGEHSLPFSTWSLSKLAEFLVAEGVAGDISLEGLRTLLRAEGVSFQRVKTWKSSKDPGYEAKKAIPLTVSSVDRRRAWGWLPLTASTLAAYLLGAGRPCSGTRKARGRGSR